ncbi:Phage protein [Escherichia phage rV5_ev146]|uniref:Phage protein n=1 Tax=Escherichia phage rV5_ev146 TaxID=2695844 RepID=A0A653HBU2_9CAUD|nr:Phage protein [Escherichia phage rV5_ev146]
MNKGWTFVDGVENMPLGKYIVAMADENGKVDFGVCEVVLAGSGDYAHKTGIINGHFYFDYNPVVAYMAMPELELPKEGADV